MDRAHGSTSTTARTPTKAPSSLGPQGGGDFGIALAYAKAQSPLRIPSCGRPRKLTRRPGGTPLGDA